MSVFQPPPTWALPIEIDEKTKEPGFSQVWLKWFIDLVGIINSAGGGGGFLLHNSLGGLQGGTLTERYHITGAQVTGLTGGANTALHFHLADRNEGHISFLALASPLVL